LLDASFLLPPARLSQAFRIVLVQKCEQTTICRLALQELAANALRIGLQRTNILPVQQRFQTALKILGLIEFSKTIIDAGPHVGSPRHRNFRM
jgi:hypothetical protein